MAKKRILVVDDNAVVRSMVRQLFEAHPAFEVVGGAENGRDALEKARSLNPDLMILDLAMPVMTGLEAAPLLKKILPQIRLILFTVHEGNEVERLARDAGVDALVSKARGASSLIPQALALLKSTGQETPAPRRAKAI